MKLLPVALALAPCCGAMATSLRVDVSSMPRILFTGDSQTCGRVGAWDYPQMLSWGLPIRVLNTAVGGTNVRHLLEETSGGTAEVKRGEREVRGTKVPWHAGPYPGQTIRLGTQQYTIDRIVVRSYKDSASSIWLTEPAREDFSGTDYAIEPGWRVRVRERRPDYACFMYSVNDTGWRPEQFRAHVREMARRVGEMPGRYGAPCRPVFLSGFPLMSKDRGGSHPGANAQVAVRAEDLRDVCAEEGIPFGDVFSYLMTMDAQSTSVWVDTVHPTTDGSLPALLALREILAGLGVLANPYYVRGFRWEGDNATAPDTGARTPFSTSQPDYAADGKDNEALFDLAAIDARDEYGRLEQADGRFVESEKALLLQMGIGDPALVEAAAVELVTGTPVRSSVFDWTAGRWGELGDGRLDRTRVADCCRDGSLWVLLQPADGPVKLDYVAVVLEGAMQPFAPRPRPDATVWPEPELLTYPGQDGNLLPNGDLTAATDGPTGWEGHGEEAVYVRAGVVAEGTGAFVLDRRVDLFRAPGQRFTTTARPLDMLQVSGGGEDASGDFLVSQVVDDETLRVRRFPAESADGLSFELLRSSGCAPVPGGCALQCAGESCWEATATGLPAGDYRLSVFYRAYAPGQMSARYCPGQAARLTVAHGGSAMEQDLETSFAWRRHSTMLRGTEPCDVTVRLQACGEVAVQFTGVSLVPAE